MPKIQFLDPKESRKAGFVEFQPIPVNQYQKTVKEERENFSDDELKAILEAARERNIRVISDEIYHRLTYDRPDQTALAFDDSVTVIKRTSHAG